MKYRILILFALVLGFASKDYAQSPPLNCTHGSWQIAGEPQKDNGCNGTVTDTRIVNEKCMTTAGASARRERGLR